MMSVVKVDAGRCKADTVPLANMVPSQNPYGTSRPTYDNTSTEPSPNPQNGVKYKMYIWNNCRYKTSILTLTRILT